MAMMGMKINRMAPFGHADQLAQGCIPPRMWELDRTSSWINYHLRLDHQGATAGIGMNCRTDECHTLPSAPIENEPV